MPFRKSLKPNETVRQLQWKPLQCFDTVGCVTGRASRPVKNPDSAISKVLTHSFGGLWRPTRLDIDIIPRKNNRLVKQNRKQ